MANIGATTAFYKVETSLTRANTEVSKSMERLATGKANANAGDRSSYVAMSDTFRLDYSGTKAGIKGVFCGGTTMDKQYARFLVEEVCESGQIGFVPTYGNTLMGLARHHPIGPENDYSIAYYAPQPRAVLRVVNPDTNKAVDYDTWGRVELTTLTKEFFMPRFLERDEALRRKPWDEAPWDGVAEVRPFGAMEKKIVEGVY